jgi:2-hydroxy-3-oxopropionate reductase
LFNVCVAQGGAGWDHSGLVRAIEHMSSFAIGDKPGTKPTGAATKG